MKKRISIDDVSPGMFVEAQVHSERDDGQLRHFLAPIDAVYDQATNKRARLTRRKHKQVAHAGGLLLSTDSHVEALKSTGLSVITINTDKGSDVGQGIDSVDVEEIITDGANYADILLGPDPDGSDVPAPPSASSEDPAGEEDCFLDVLEIGTPLTRTEPPAPPPGSGPDRIALGSARKGWMKVETSADGQQAVLRVLSFGGDKTLGLEDVLQALEDHYGLRSGFDHTLIRQLVAQAQASPRHVLRGEFGVAEAQSPPPVDPAAPPADIEFTFLKSIRPTPSLAYASLKTALGLQDLDAILALDPLTRAVQPGEELAAIEHEDDDQSLLDIFGRGGQGPRNKLQAGGGVRATQDHHTARLFGYACYLDELDVLSPLWISPDEVEAYFIAFRQAGDPCLPTRQDLQTLFDQAGIRLGIQEEACEELTRHWPGQNAPRAILVASGTAPLAGQDAQIAFEFNANLWPGAYLDDGSVDYRERNAFNNVKRGQLIGTVEAASAGQPGQSIRGEEIEAPDGRADAFVLSKNIRSEGDPPKLYAGIDGTVRVEGNTVRLQEVIHIHGDVDYSMGNIDAGKDVCITGSLRPGFEIRLEGDLTIGGTIEGGAAVHAAGNVTVGGGIVGKNTKIVALGSLHAKFIQNARVMARGDITVGNYLLNADVRAGGRLVVRQTDDARSGTIIGGHVVASERIDASTLGSASTDRTQVGIAASPETDARLHKLDQTIAFCDQFVARAFRTLGLSTIDTDELKRLIQRTPRQERQPILTVLKQLKKATTTRARALEKRANVRNTSRRQLTGGEIHVRRVAHADVEIQIADQQLTLTNDLEAPVFSWSADQILTR